MKQSIQKGLQGKQVIGYEIGGFYEIGQLDQVQPVNFDELARLDIQRPLQQTERPKARIGLLASRANFDFWHGERSNDRNIHQDALVGAYALLSGMQNVDVVVFGERALAQDAELVDSLDAVFVPHQVVLADGTKSACRISGRLAACSSRTCGLGVCRRWFRNERLDARRVRHQGRPVACQAAEF